MKKIVTIVEKTETGYSAYAENYPVFTVGNNLDELKSNILEALNLYFEGEHVPVKLDDIKITLDLPQFFEFYKVINAKALSERIGMNQSLLAQYINGNKKPSSAQTQRILKGVQQIGRELSEIGFLL
ncbi:MAG: helix-turn-helix transcriptional regulator [Prolixibacteraceae bacterium]|nr:helix-turn-helix transcriptional regulator [Prolixibacteraceae bacterium]